MREVRKALIPAAGFGTRFLPFTKAVPKELVPVVDKPTIQYVVEEAVASGITQILVVTSVGKDAIQNHFNPNFELETRLRESGKDDLLAELKKIDSLADIHYIHQQELNGLGDAVLRGKTFVGDDPFAILLGDTITSSDSATVTSQLISAFNDTGSSVIALERVPMEKVSRYGIVDGENEGCGRILIREIVEKPAPASAPSNLAVASRYVFTPEIFDFLENTKKGKGGEIQLTDAISAMLAEHPTRGLEFDGRRHDIGNKLEFVKATVEFALKRDDLRNEIADFLNEITTPRK